MRRPNVSSRANLLAMAAFYLQAARLGPSSATDGRTKMASGRHCPFASPKSLAEHDTACGEDHLHAGWIMAVLARERLAQRFQDQPTRQHGEHLGCRGTDQRTRVLATDGGRADWRSTPPTSSAARPSGMSSRRAPTRAASAPATCAARPGPLGCVAAQSAPTPRLEPFHISGRSCLVMTAPCGAASEAAAYYVRTPTVRVDGHRHVGDP
jgi:hypothetical protein